MPCEKDWNPDNGIHSLDGRVILITGGYSGLGLETALQLAKHNPARIYIAGRSPERADAAIRKLKESIAASKAEIRFLPMDLTSLQSVQGAVASFTKAENRLDLLINNAGIMFVAPGLTKDGYEIQFGTNYLSHALLTQLLLPSLKATTVLNPDVRVVSVSSASEGYSGKKSYDLSGFKTTMESENTQTRYCLSKLAQVHWTTSIAQQNPDIKFISIHPGTVKTNLGSDADVGLLFTVFARAWVAVKAVETEEGALNQLWAAASQDVVSGEFYHPVGVAGKGSKASKDKDMRQKLWEWTQTELGAFL